MTRPIFVLLGVVAGLLAPAVGSKAAEGPSREVPELRTLAPYAGDWVTVGTIKPLVGLPEGSRVEGTARGEWALGGRFLRQTWETKAIEGLPAMSGTTLMTFEPDRKAYRSWSFYSTGAVVEATGTWDAAEKTMTWTHRNPESGATSVTRASFAREGAEDWSIVDKDHAGAVVMEFVGKNTRRKP